MRMVARLTCLMVLTGTTWGLCQEGDFRAQEDEEAKIQRLVRERKHKEELLAREPTSLDGGASVNPKLLAAVLDNSSGLRYEERDIYFRILELAIRTPLERQERFRAQFREERKMAQLELAKRYVGTRLNDLPTSEERNRVRLARDVQEKRQPPIAGKDSVQRGAGGVELLFDLTAWTILLCLFGLLSISLTWAIVHDPDEAPVHMRGSHSIEGLISGAAFLAVLMCVVAIRRNSELWACRPLIGFVAGVTAIFVSWHAVYWTRRRATSVSAWVTRLVDGSRHKGFTSTIDIQLGFILVATSSIGLMVVSAIEYRVHILESRKEMSRTYDFPAFFDLRDQALGLQKSNCFVHERSFVVLWWFNQNGRGGDDGGRRGYRGCGRGWSRPPCAGSSGRPRCYCSRGTLGRPWRGLTSLAGCAFGHVRVPTSQGSGN